MIIIVIMIPLFELVETNTTTQQPDERKTETSQVECIFAFISLWLLWF